jgi:DNA primase
MKPYNKEEATENLKLLKLSVDVRYLIESLGFTVSKDSAKELRAPCIIHGGDNKSAFRMNKDKRSWVCFTHGCHEEHGSDIISLIKASLNIDFKEALSFLENLVGDVSSYKKRLVEDKFKRDREKFIKEYRGVTLESCVSENNLQKYKPFRSDRFIKDGFDKQTLDYFEIAGGYVDTYKLQRDIIPIRDDSGTLVAYSLRDIRDNPPDDDFKYLLTRGFDKDHVLYNLHNVVPFVTKFPVIVVEGFKSVWKLYEQGIYNVVAIMGKTLLQGQARLLKAYASSGVLLMLDADKAGRKGIQNALDNYPELNITPIYILEEGADPSCLTTEQNYRYLNEYIRG